MSFPRSFSFLCLLILAIPLHAAKDPLPSLAANAGRIIVYRDALMSAQKQPAVLIDGSETRAIKARSYFEIDRPAGTYALSLAGETAAPVTVSIGPGETTYVCINVHNTPGGTELYPKSVDRPTALREIAGCKYLPPDPSMAAAYASKTPLRVLLTFGGHKFEEEKFFAMWDAWQKEGLLTYTRCPQPEDTNSLEPNATSKYDVIVMYDMAGDLSAEQQKAFTALLGKGIGVVSLHHNLAARETWPLWATIVGGKFLHGTETIDGRSYDKSTYEHNVWIKVGVPDSHNPITRGVEPFYIYDETYGKTYRATDIQPVLTTDNPNNQREIAWTKWFGNSPVFYFQLGHDNQAWSHPLFQKVLLQGMHWAASEAAKRRSSP